MSNLDLWEKVRAVPDTAKKEIGAGRLKGMTDINPVWRLKTLTETFGPCGIGWKYDIVKQWLEPAGNGEIAAFTNIMLYTKENGAWGDPIPGTGGSMFVASERTGLHVSDECYKMALTDAISVACKPLGVGADVYWDKDPTKYTKPAEAPDKAETPNKKLTYKCADCHKEIIKYKTKSAESIARESLDTYGRELCYECAVKAFGNTKH